MKILPPPDDRPSVQQMREKYAKFGGWNASRLSKPPTNMKKVRRSPKKEESDGSKAA